MAATIGHVQVLYRWNKYEDDWLYRVSGRKKNWVTEFTPILKKNVMVYYDTLKCFLAPQDGQICS
jgi:hypothetical protein